MYRASRVVALIGIPVVAVGAALIAMSADPTDPNPKGTLAAIFGLIGGLVLILLLVQGWELAAARRRDSEPALAPGAEVVNPMTMRDIDLWAALATGPVGNEAAEAYAEMWGTVRESRRTLWIVCILIFVAVPMTYMLETFVPVLVGAALIALVAVVAAIRTVGGGGSLDRGYAGLDRSLGPLGMGLDERPTVGVAMRVPPTPGLKTDIRGALRFSGERHGRPVSVVMDGGAGAVRVGIETESFEARSSDGKVRLKEGGGEAKARIEEALSSVPGSTEWKNLKVRGDADGVEVRRKPMGSRWLPDLWLAERIADAIEGRRSR